MIRNQQSNVSIRLMSGGHAFSESDIEALRAAGDGAIVEVVTPKTVLRPVEGFVPADAHLDLEATGYTIAPNEVVVHSCEVDGRVAIMAVSRECADAIDKLGVKVCYTSPLILGGDIAEGSYLALYGDVLYIRVYRDGLRFAEAIEVHGAADIIYYLESVNRVYNIYNMYACASGDVKRLEELCKRYTKLKF